MGHNKVILTLNEARGKNLMSVDPSVWPQDDGKFSHWLTHFTDFEIFLDISL